MPELCDGDLVVDAEEQAYLRRSFRRFLAPYLVGIAACIALMGGLPWLRSEPPRQGPTPAAASQDALRAELEALRGELARVAAGAQEARQLAGAAARPAAEAETRVLGETAEWKALLARLEAVHDRVERLESRPAATASANGGDVSRSLQERMYNIEVRQQRAEEEANTVQKSLLDRVYAMESSRDKQGAERTALEASLLERLRALEDRFYALETGPSDAPPAAPAR